METSTTLSHVDADSSRWDTMEAQTYVRFSRDAQTGEATLMVPADTAKRIFDNVLRREAQRARSKSLATVFMRNLVRRINFLELFQQVTTGSVDAEQFDEEINLETDRYQITTDSVVDSTDMPEIVGIAETAGQGIREFTVNEVEELFSLPAGALSQPKRLLNEEPRPEE